MGRPKLPKGVGKTAYLWLRVTPEIRRAAEKRAWAEGMSMAEYVARLIRADLDGAAAAGRRGRK